MDIQSEIQKIAARLLKNKEVAMVIGYGAGSAPNRTAPVFIEKEKDVGKLVFNRFCVNNLSLYLPRLKEKGKIAIVAKPCDVRTIVCLIQEKQIERDKVHIISFACPGLLEKDGKTLYAACAECAVTLPPVYDTLIGEAKEMERNEPFTDRVADFFSKMPAERWEMFKAEMEKCIRCYACRNACPMCYCEECFVERSLPRWIGEGSEVTDTMIFHIVRAIHTAGRCGECGACARACPMDVNLAPLAKQIREDMLNLFHHQAGVDPNAPAALETFKPDDYNDFIK
jgi:ferredoxin